MRDIIDISDTIPEGRGGFGLYAESGYNAQEEENFANMMKNTFKQGWKNLAETEGAHLVMLPDGLITIVTAQSKKTEQPPLFVEGTQTDWLNQNDLQYLYAA